MPRKQGGGEKHPATGKTKSQVKREDKMKELANPLRDPAEEQRKKENP